MSKPKRDGDRSERDEYFHNKGQEDASKGKYDRPWDDHIGGLTNSKSDARDNDKYSEGWRNTKDQEDKDNK